MAAELYGLGYQEKQRRSLSYVVFDRFEHTRRLFGRINDKLRKEMQTGHGKHSLGHKRIKRIKESRNRFEKEMGYGEDKGSKARRKRQEREEKN